MFIRVKHLSQHQVHRIRCPMSGSYYGCQPLPCVTGERSTGQQGTQEEEGQVEDGPAQDVLAHKLEAWTGSVAGRGLGPTRARISHTVYCPSPPTRMQLCEEDIFQCCV